VAHDRTFAVVLEPQAEGGFTVLVPALPEIVTEGDTTSAVRSSKNAAWLAKRGNSSSE